MEDAIYGGRIDNAFDLRVLRSYLRYDKKGEKGKRKGKGKGKEE